METELLELTRSKDALRVDLPRRAIEDYKKSPRFEMGLVRWGVCPGVWVLAGVELSGIGRGPGVGSSGLSLILEVPGGCPWVYCFVTSYDPPAFQLPAFRQPHTDLPIVTSLVLLMAAARSETRRIGRDGAPLGIPGLLAKDVHRASSRPLSQICRRIGRVVRRFPALDRVVEQLSALVGARHEVELEFFGEVVKG
ncbi:hypothetical protein B296_00003891 [Ensete ventricosum]|uniref:Uncharacterized protein n=1 Tax=Ensete ventricosum TaxID=4639 RepID=A0A427AQD8_ENSVE|nr:hypothetical protein B296_00003891 [Ensete ventricosum]